MKYIRENPVTGIKTIISREEFCDKIGQFYDNINKLNQDIEKLETGILSEISTPYVKYFVEAN